ncbi:T9SS type A sorting domain-containing protein [Cytophagales bacterium LB-30]|uniref:T9SS type A sorting domain-containing protein n=1 Tax=Shiella aurantiaca TaxID=3058365 RepID=A0ABT8F344_9BACT|nr:T9SS type A sorting domain-containing protein [Shiella aurantiaca]MDN4164779.1 T9SS type A sorting domain-containing protein [Shiella aurantiaca]
MKLSKILFSLLLLSLITSGVWAQSVAERRFNGNTELDADNIISLYPQPATEYVVVQIKNSTLTKVSFQMYNIIGVPVNIEAEQISETEYKIPIKDLNMGYYMVVVKDDPARFQKAYKFLKK